MRCLSISPKSGAMKPWLIIAGLAGALAVALGAMAAHVAEAEAAHRLETAVRYLMWHALALLGVTWLATTGARRWANLAGGLYLSGMVLFCGTLAFSALSGHQALTLLAPAGGLAFIAGWLALALAGLRWRSQNPG